MKTSTIATIVLTIALGSLVGCGKKESSKSKVSYNTIGNLTGVANADFVSIRDAMLSQTSYAGLGINSQVNFINTNMGTVDKKFLGLINYTKVTTTNNCEYNKVIGTRESGTIVTMRAASMDGNCSSTPTTWSDPFDYVTANDQYLQEFLNITATNIVSVTAGQVYLSGMAPVTGYMITVQGFPTNSYYVVAPSLPLVANPVYKQLGTTATRKLQIYQGFM